MSSRSDSSCCKYCHKELHSDSAMKRHIAATFQCKQSWEKEIWDLASNSTGFPKSSTTHQEVNNPGVDYPDTWDDLHAFAPELSPEPRGHVEDGDDEESLPLREISDTKNRRFVREYPRPVGIPVGQGKTKFQQLNESQIEEGQSIYAPFTNDEEWGLAQWLSRRVGQKATDEYLKLSIVS